MVEVAVATEPTSLETHEELMLVIVNALWIRRPVEGWLVLDGGPAVKVWAVALSAPALAAVGRSEDFEI
jgi:hypothetical protein